MAKSLEKNYVYNVAYQILTIITPIVTTPYLARVLGADGIGIISFTNSVLGIFTLFAVLGTSMYGQRKVAYCRDNVKERSLVLWNTLGLSIITTAIVAVVYLIFCSYQPIGLVTIYYANAISFLAILFDVTWFFQGMEEFGLITARNAIVRFIGIGFLFTCVNTHDDIIVYVVGNGVIVLISNISLLPYLKNNVIWLGLKQINPFTDFKEIITMFLPTIAVSIYTVLDKTMLGVLADNFIENGYYEQSMKISRIGVMFVISLGVVMVPRIGYHYARKEYNVIRDYMYKNCRFVWMLSLPLTLGISGVSCNLVPWFLGDSFIDAEPVIIISSFIIIMIGINNVLGIQLLIPTGRQNIFTQTVLVGALINVVLNLVLIPMYFAAGAAFSSVIAEMGIAVLQMYILRKELSAKKIIASSKRYVISSLIMLIILLLENLWFPADIFHTMIMVISGITVYFFLLIVMQDELAIKFLNRWMVKIRKNKKGSE